jgi:tubulin polyglutamylase TTLL1
MIDENLKPWLIEVNACPSLTTTTDADLMLKMQVIDDMFKVVIPPDWGEDGKFGANQC